MKILKFGGSSVANAENIKKVIQIIFESSKKNEEMVIVVSALGGVTNNLIELTSLASKGDEKFQSLLKTFYKQHNQVIGKLIKSKNQKNVLIEVKKKFNKLSEALNGISLLKELSPRSLDLVMSFGEQLSSYIICEAIKSSGLECNFVDVRTIIKTDENFGSANVNIQTSYELISNYFKNNSKLSIVGGFIGSTQDGITTTLGRGGSDYTASLIGAALNASVIEIWTDVDGVMTADPREVPNAFPLSKISYEEAGELAHFGAKVIHPKTMKPARLRNIPIQIKNTFNPKSIGTRICSEKFTHDYPIKGISSLDNIALLRIQSNDENFFSETAARIFDALSRSNIEILLITQASHEQSISIAVSSLQSKKAKIAIEKIFSLELKAQQMLPISIEENLSIVAIVGKQMKGVPGISGKFFSTLGNNKVNIVAIAQGSSELNISAVIFSKNETKALQAIHDAFFGLTDKTINLFLVGTGLIGSTLLRQIDQLRSPIRICGLANSRFMLMDSQGFSNLHWKQKLLKGKTFELQNFVNEMIELNLPGSVFVDCTTSEEVVTVYEKVINNGIAIVTPNKKANSGLFSQYQNLRDLAKHNQVPFLYGTNVGAGLPIIHTIKNLVSSGDEVLKIEAVLSGTLSYIFNIFSQSEIPFSQIVRDARANGYTEPDPRDDLNGMDVARKILILAREIGLKLELDQIKIKPALPEEYFVKNSIDEFFIELEKLDSKFEKKKIEARKNNLVHRYIATLHEGNAEVKLQEVGKEHPFYFLSGSDNIISVTTKRYSNTPIVIKGPGAGAEATAGGLLAGIITLFK